MAVAGVVVLAGAPGLGVAPDAGRFSGSLFEQAASVSRASPIQKGAARFE
jgi:hypothetical protein